MGNRLRTTCCIAGGGPAGMVLGYLLARGGVDVTVLEKHGDFLRDFRGDTIHPSTLEIMHQLGLLDELLQRPHQEAKQIAAMIGETEVTVADFRHLPTHCGFIAFMPQWDFLDFLAEKARAYPSFHLLRNAEITDLVEDDGRIVGARATTPDGPLEIDAKLVVGADGRHSTVRARAKLEIRDLGAPIDVLWFRLRRKETDRDIPLGRFNDGKILVMLFRGEYWQCGYVIAKGGIDAIRARGLEAFRANVEAMAQFGDHRADEIADWDQVKLLTVTVNRLTRWWKPGLVCVGDSAHAMSPVGGVGINLAIQDAVAAANILVAPLRDGDVRDVELEKVEERRLFPTRVTQRFQTFVQDRVITQALAGGHVTTLPLPLQLLRQFPRLQGITARVIGIGVRPERVEAPEILQAAGR